MLSCRVAVGSIDVFPFSVCNSEIVALSETVIVIASADPVLRLARCLL